MPLLESIVTGIYRNLQQRYHKNNGRMTYLHGSQDKVKRILQRPDWLLMDYDATVIDNSALQSVYATLKETKPVKWLAKTAYAYIKGGFNKVREEKTKQNLSSLTSTIQTFMLGGKEQESDRWDAFCIRYLVHKARDIITGNPTNYTKIAKNLNWTIKRATHLMYPGAITFTGKLKEANPNLKVGLITRNIEPIVYPGIEALGLENNLENEFYLTDNKSDKIDQIDLQRGQTLVYLWDSKEDTAAVKKTRQKLGQENVLSIQVVANETEIDTKYADVVIFKNYCPLIRLMAQAASQAQTATTTNQVSYQRRAAK